MSGRSCPRLQKLSTQPLSHSTENWPVLLNSQKDGVTTLAVKGSGITLIQTVIQSCLNVTSCFLLSAMSVGLFDLFSLKAAESPPFPCCENAELVRQHLSGMTRAFPEETNWLAESLCKKNRPDCPQRLNSLFWKEKQLLSYP